MKFTNLSKNIILSEIAVVLKLLLQFAVRTVFIHRLAIEYLGAGDLFATIVSVLSIGQMGFGNAMKYAMFRPIAAGDHSTIRAISRLYRRIYCIIGFILCSIGFLIFPLLYASRSGEIGMEGIAAAYGLLMLDMLVYYLFKGDKDLLIASQKEYIATFSETVALMLQSALQIGALVIFKSFMLYFAAKFLGSILLMFLLHRQARTAQPCLKSKEKSALSRNDWLEIRKNMHANMLNTIGVTITDNMDYLLIFFTGGLGQVGLLTNYKLIINSVTQFLHPLFRSALGPVGHIGVSEDRKVMMQYFYVTLFVAFWCFGFSAIALLCLMNPFVALWAGNQYVISMATVVVMVLVFFSGGIYTAVSLFRDALGLFWVNRYRKILESCLNLVLSLILVKPLGVLGLFLGTLISDLCVTFWMNPYHLYRYGFHEKSGPYFRYYFRYAGLILFAGIVTFFCCKTAEILPDPAGFLVKMMICTLVPNTIFYLTVRKTAEFCFLRNYIKNILGHKKPKM